MISVLKLSLLLNQQYIKIDLNNLQEQNWDEVTEEQVRCVLFHSGYIFVKNYNEERGLILAVKNGSCRLYIILQEVSCLSKGDNSTRYV